MKLLPVHLSASSYDLLSLSAKCPGHPVVTLSVCVLSMVLVTKFHSHIKQWVRLRNSVVEYHCLWDVTPCSLVVADQHFRGTYWLDDDYDDDKEKRCTPIDVAIPSDRNTEMSCNRKQKRN
jgi:hypothetical protein